MLPARNVAGADTFFDHETNGSQARSSAPGAITRLTRSFPTRKEMS